jgi:hypothetical protein
MKGHQGQQLLTGFAEVKIHSTKIFDFIRNNLYRIPKGGALSDFSGPVEQSLPLAMSTGRKMFA